MSRSSRELKMKTVGDVCRFILFSTQSKKPIRKSDITAIVKKANLCKTQEIMEAVKNKLLKGFGFSLVEAPNRASYFLVTKSSKEYHDEKNELRGKLLNCDESNKARRGLISVILQLLILNGGDCDKETLDHHFFNRFDISQFGLTPKQLVTELKQQKWICERTNNSFDQPKTIYSIGPRADIETTQEWQYMAAHQMVNGMKPNHDDRALQRIRTQREMNKKKNENAKSKKKGRPRSLRR